MSEPLARAEALRPPKQRRSRDALRRILDATRALLAEHDAEEVTLRGIAAEAGVSQSSLFARFRTKEALLDYVHEENCRARLELAEAAIADLEAREVEMDELVRSLIRTFVEHLRTDGPLVRSLTHAGRQVPSILERETGLRRRIAERARDTVLARLPEARRKQAAPVIDSQISVMMTSAPQLVSDGAATLLGADLSDDELVGQLSELALRLAGAWPPEPR